MPLERLRGGDRRLPASAHRRRSSPRFASSGCSSSTSRPTSGSATPTSTRAGTATLGAPISSAMPSMGSPSCTANGSARPTWSPTPAATRPRRCSHSPRWPRAGLIADVVIDAKSGVSGAGRGGGDRLTSSTVTRTRLPYGVGGHRHEPEIAQELACSPAPGPGLRRSRSSPTCCRSIRASSSSCYVRPAREVEAEELAGLYEDRYGDERSSRSSGIRPACATFATRTCAGSMSPATPAAGSSSSPRSTTSGRAPPDRRSRT